MTRMSCGVFLCLLLLWTTVPALAAESVTIRCEVMEVSEPFSCTSDRLKGVHYLLLHHADPADMETLSSWLKANSGREIVFLVNHERYRGVLCRLSHCFGRGLLIHEDEVNVRRKDIIEVILPTAP